MRRLLPLVLVALLAACGGGHRAAAPPMLPHDLAQRLAGESDLVARRLDAGDECGALTAATRLQSDTNAAISAGQVRPALQTPLLSATAQLAAKIQCAPPEKDHGHGKGHGKHGGGD